MLNSLTNFLAAVLFCCAIGGIGYEVVNREATLARIHNGEARVQRELEVIAATKAAQLYAAPALEIADNLSTENAQLQCTLMGATEKISDLEIELATTKEALEDSVKLIQDGVDQSEFYMKHIQYLERLLDDIISKLPEDQRPDVQKLEDKEEPYWDEPSEDEVSGRYHLRTRTRTFFRRVVA